LKTAVTVLLLAATARADGPIVLRLATIAPRGSAWAREIDSFSAEVTTKTQGEVRLKWYMDGVAGDENEQLQRIERGQLDGSASGQMLCEHVAPTLRVMRLPGVFQSRDEAVAVMNQLQPSIEAEAHQHGFVLPAYFGLGPDVLFTRTPITSFEDLRRTKMWRWSVDEVGIAMSRMMGMSPVPLPIYQAARAYDSGSIDGFVAIPSAALAFQWSAQVRYVMDLRGSYIWGCLVVAERAFSRLAPEHQRIFRAAAAKGAARFEEVGRRTDEQLLGGLFERQGLRVTPVSEQLAAAFFEAARQARARASEYVPPSTLERVLQLLADYRAEHR
jgi:TRAP-type C4-dicarboxylate transport system substrate-binding protein